MQKTKIVVTKAAKKIIIDKLSNSEINLKLTDVSDSFNILLDENAKHLLKTYYESQLKEL